MHTRSFGNSVPSSRTSRSLLLGASCLFLALCGFGQLPIATAMSPHHAAPAAAPAPQQAVSSLVPVPSNAGDPQVRYVSKYGTDSNDGASWSSAKLTIAAAVNALPVGGRIGSGGFHYGTVNIGAGLFVEAGNLELNSSISYNCSMNGLLGASGTTIRLAPNANKSLFTYSPDWESSQPSQTAGSHYVTMSNCSLDGNSAGNRQGSGDLVRLLGGGYNTFFHNVSFQNASRYGLYIEQRTVNFACYSCTFANDLGGAVYVNATSGGSILSMYDTQLDNDGPEPIVINTAQDSGNGLFTFVNLKSEGTALGSMQHVIRHNPAPEDNGAPPDTINVIGGWAYQSAAGGGDSFGFEAAGNGTEAHWSIVGTVVQAGYTNHVFHSTNSGYISSSSGVATNLTSVDRRAARAGRAGPDLELSEGVSITAGGNPSGVVTAQPGSLYLDRVDGELWFKQSGTGTSGWVRLAGTGH